MLDGNLMTARKRHTPSVCELAANCRPFMILYLKQAHLLLNNVNRLGIVGCRILNFLN